MRNWPATLRLLAEIVRRQSREEPHAGATEAQVAEALGVAVLMNGRPGTVYAPRAFAAFRDFVAAPRPPAEPGTG
jgi:hypothetical protein